MTALSVAIAVENRKNTAATVPRATGCLILAGITGLATALTLAAGAGNEQIIAQLGPQAGLQGPMLLTGAAAQITAAGGLLGFGAALSWMFGREFTDRTITGLFALPIPRPAIAAAKLVSYLYGVALIAAALTVAIAVAGTAMFGFHAWDGPALENLWRLLALAVLSGLLAIPAAWAATLGRGPLPGIAVTIGLIILAQVSIVSGAGAWFPIAAPALWAIHPDTVSTPQLALVIPLALTATALTLHSWTRLQLDR